MINDLILKLSILFYSFKNLIECQKKECKNSFEEPILYCESSLVYCGCVLLNRNINYLIKIK